MAVIRIFDTTLRDGEQSPGCSMTISEKIEVAKQLEALGVDVIEAGFSASSPGDFDAVKAVAATVARCSVASLARCVLSDIDTSYESVKNAFSPMIHLFIATSAIHMRDKLRMTPEQVLTRVTECVAYAKSLCECVEFSAEDASRSDRDFLVRVYAAAIRSGAAIINVTDTVGYATPGEFEELVAYVRKHTEGIGNAILSVHCHNDLGMAVANSISGVRAGATQVECTLNGIGERAGNAALEEIVMALNTRRDLLSAECSVATAQIYRSSKLLSTITGMAIAPNKPIVGTNAFSHEAGIHQHGVMMNRETYEIMTPQSIGLPSNRMILGKHSGRHAFEERLTEMGLTLSGDQLSAVFAQFKALCDKRKGVTDSELEALVTDRVGQVPQTYTLDRFVVNSGNTITSTASVRLKKDEQLYERVAIGNGPVEASFRAVDKIVGNGFTLEHFALSAVTDGPDALGECLVRIRKGDRVYSGKGLSTDVVEATLHAYLSAINRMLFVTEGKGEHLEDQRI